MIGYLRGKVAEVFEDKAIIDVSGVGYKVEIPSGRLLEGEDTELFIHTALRENDLSLWGFTSRNDLRVFLMLLGVNGVGLRTAQSLIYGLGVGKIASAVLNGQPGELKVPGVGKKTSEKIIIDLRDKLKKEGIESDSDSSSGAVSETVEEVLIAIERLGYKRSEVQPLIDKLDLNEYADSQALLRAILINV